jgi:hypothetical protein
MAFGIDDIIATGLKIIDKVIPDPTAKAAAELELYKLKQAGEFKEIDANLQVIQGQVDINKLEAGSDSLLKSGWRPAAGWVCVIGLFSEFLVRPYAASFGVIVPSINGSLFELLFGMLGLGGLRTVEKLKGVN